MVARLPWTLALCGSYNDSSAVVSTAHSEPLAARPTRHRIAMDRRRCIVTPDRVDIRPSRSSILLPSAGAILGLLLFAVVFWQSALPFGLVVLLVLAAVLVLLLSGLGLVYSAAAARVVVDRAGESVAWQRGLPGLGAHEMVPFWKIQQFEVEDTVGRRRRGLPQDVVRFEVSLLKTSGRRLRVGVVTVPRSLAAEGLERARLVAEAIASVTGKRVEVAKPRRRRPRVVRPHYMPSRR